VIKICFVNANIFSISAVGITSNVKLYEMIMDDAEIHSLQLVDHSLICKLYLLVGSDKQLSDDIIINIIAYMRNQLRCWKDSHDATLCVRDHILLCLSTLLSVVKKKLCTSSALLHIMNDADFTLIVSICVV